MLQFRKWALFVKLLFWNVYLFNCSPPSFSLQRKRDRWGTHEILCICKNNGNNNNNSSNTGRHFIASLPYARLSMILPILTHLILIITLRGRIDYHSTFQVRAFIRHRVVVWFTLEHASEKWWSWDSNPGFLETVLYNKHTQCSSC